MIIIFIVFLFVLFLLVMILAFKPLLKIKVQETAQKIAINKTPTQIQRDKNQQRSIKRLTNELAKGKISQAEFNYYEKQLKNHYQRMLPQSESAIENHTKTHTKSFKIKLFLGLFFVPVLTFIVYFSSVYRPEIGHWITLKQKVKTAGKIIASGQELTPKQQENLANVTALDMARVMQSSLNRTENDADGWLALGRLYEQATALELAKEAYQQAVDLSPQRQDLVISLARSQIALKNYTQANLILDGLLKQTPAHQSALLMRGFSSFYQQDYQLAIDYWQKLMSVHTATENSVQSNQSIALMQKQITTAQGLLQEQKNQIQNKKNSGLVNELNAAWLTEGDSDTIKTVATIFVDIQFENTHNLEGILFVVAKESGIKGRPPLAIKRINLKEWFATQAQTNEKSTKTSTIQLSLTDNDAMLPSRNLSSINGAISVQAFVSLTGGVSDKSGGQSAIEICETLNSNKSLNKPINLLINR